MFLSDASWRRQNNKRSKSPSSPQTQGQRRVRKSLCSTNININTDTEEIVNKDIELCYQENIERFEDIVSGQLNDSCFDESDFQAIDALISSNNDLTSSIGSVSPTKVSNSSLNAVKRQNVLPVHVLKNKENTYTVTNSISAANTSVAENTQGTTQVTSDLQSVLLSNAEKPLDLPLDADDKYITQEFNISTFDADSSINSINSSQLNINDKGSFYGLPLIVKQLVHDFKGIEELYDWQKECLNLEAIKTKKNLIYSLPTSGGKTLVAEILILRELLCNKKNAILVLPYVSIVQEKVRSMSPFALALNFLVEEYAGGKGQYPPRRRRWKNVVYVATIEKALGLVNSLVESKRLSELGLVVVDELHMLGESGRGALLECLLTRLMFAKERIQVIGMSATIGNLNDLSQFLHAETYTQDFRPVELKEYVKLENRILSISKSSEELFQPERCLAILSRVEKERDPDQLSTLVREVVPAHSCLVFCSTKKNCENVAILLCRFMNKSMQQHMQTEKKALFHALVVEGNGSVCPILKKTLPYGIAYHHSGLTMNERNLLEEGYRAGVLCCLCCTSTLAAGVNLPAKRVILRSPKVGLSFLTLSQYKQMVGRAGRAGMDSVGESILVCQQVEVAQVKELLSSSMNQCLSQLHESNGIILEQLILSSVGLGQTCTRAEIKSLLRGSLLYVQAERLQVEVGKLVDDVITRLISSKVLVVANTTSTGGTVSTNTPGKVKITNDTKLTISNLGRAAIKGNMSMAQAQALQKDLKLAQGGLNLLTPLHLLYLVTPPDNIESIKFAPLVFANAYYTLPPADQKTVGLIGISEGMIGIMMSGGTPRAVSPSLLRRAYVALLLREAWEGGSVWDVANKFDQPRGNVQSLMSCSSAFAFNVQNFCMELHETFWCFTALLSNLSERLAHCCAVELMPLMELPAVKKGRARQLFDAGYKTLHDVSIADPKELSVQIRHMPLKVARHIISTAKMLLVERAETLREAAEDLLEGSRHDLPPILPSSPSQIMLSPSQSMWRSPRLGEGASQQKSPRQPYWPSHPHQSQGSTSKQ